MAVDSHDDWRALNEPPDRFDAIADRFIATGDRCIELLQQILGQLPPAPREAECERLVNHWFATGEKLGDTGDMDQAVTLFRPAVKLVIHHDEQNDRRLR